MTGAPKENFIIKIGVRWWSKRGIQLNISLFT